MLKKELLKYIEFDTLDIFLLTHQKHFANLNETVTITLNNFL